MSDEDRKENDYSLEHAFRLLSSYCTNAGDKLWIITESGRSVIIHAYSEARGAREPDVVVKRHRLPDGKYLFRVVESCCRPQGRGINVN